MRSNRMSAFLLLALDFGLVALVGWLDYLTGTEFQFAIYYLIPISIAAWYTNATASLFTGAACVGVWFLANYVFGAGRTRNFVEDANAAETEIFFLLVSFLLSKLREVLKREQSMARTDHLTGAANTRVSYECVEEEVARGERYGHPFSLVYLDVDDFKAINDTLGHRAGDRLL